jgi:ABC-type branched-subunit amino acid transport system permease subunit
MAIEYLVVMVIGGTASLPGSLFGAFFLVYAYREGIETVSSETESGSDTWLLAAGLLAGVGIMFTSQWPAMLTKRIAGVLGGPQYRWAVGNLLRLVLAIVIALLFVWLFRRATEDLLDLVSLRGAITGAVLIVVVLFVPGGVASLFDRILALKWTTVGDWLRSAIALKPAAAVSEMPGESAGSAAP